MFIDLKKIIDLRHKLHRYPEISSNEFKTSKTIESFISKYKPDKIIKLAKTGLAFIFEGVNCGKTVMFRSELDALQIEESDSLTYHSLNKGVSHKCGHDGHMAILSGLAQAISNERPLFGRVILLFQPAEETLSGAKEVLNDKNFKEIEPDFIFAIHNLPGFKENSLIIKEGFYTCATKGLTIDFKGNTSHAANPEKANNPTDATIELLYFVRNGLKLDQFKKFVLATPIYTQIGTPDFGITPGTSQLKITLRAYEEKDIDKLSKKILDKAKSVANEHNLDFEFNFSDQAVSVYNNQFAIETATKVAMENAYNIIALDEPFKWTEDFGYFTQKYRGALICVGAGEIPQLHDKNYDFQDNIIEPTVKFLFNIYKKFCFDKIL